MAKATPDVERLMNEYTNVWNQGNYADVPDVVSESITLYDPGYPAVVQGHDAFEASLREIRDAFPDFHVTIDEMLASNKIVMFEWTVTATHEGELNEIPPTENQMDLTGMDKIRLATRKVHEHRIYHDLQDMFEQLGLAQEEERSSGDLPHPARGDALAEGGASWFRDALFHGYSADADHPRGESQPTTDARLSCCLSWSHPSLNSARLGRPDAAFHWLSRRTRRGLTPRWLTKPRDQ